MSLDKIKQKILEDAKREAEKIIKDAEGKKDKILKDAKARAEEIVTKAKLQYDELKKREIENKRILAELEVGKQLLAARRKILDEVFDELRSRLEKLGKEDYCAFFERLLKKSVETGKEEVVLGKEEKFLDGDFFQEINKKQGWNLRVSKHRGGFRRGFILSQGDIEVNLSIDAIIRDVKEKWEDIVVRKLFTEEGTS
ncbi:MAG: hypothetical protein H5T91_05395 [Synergistetes bacterium]|nr:MAG: hypothetical protein XD52_1364 [bacterium 42_11]MBC7331841.1 hypothetical protein [Synergistota bacterium]MDK2871356.1 V/A-type H+/Na+-transporting ATPase subunit [bacterium]